MATRDGIPSLMKWAQYLCRTLAKFSGVIAVKYPDNTALLAALAAANTACQVLLTEAAKVRDYGD